MSNIMIATKGEGFGRAAVDIICLGYNLLMVVSQPARTRRISLIL
jgi:hypothetical protein